MIKIKKTPIIAGIGISIAVFLVSVISTIAQPMITSDNWSALGEPGDGFDQGVFALEVDSQGLLYAGGAFANVVGGPEANNIAMWDGQTWTPLGSGLNNTVNSIAIDSQDNIYVTGTFTEAGGVSANFIAMWDGQTWSPLGSGLGNPGNTLTIDAQDNLYVGGTFTTAGGVNANYIAMWDGQTWSSLGSGLQNTVMKIDIDSQGSVYATGHFTAAGGNAANYVAKWDGVSWSSLGAGLSAGAISLTIDSQDNVYVGGYFQNAGDPAVLVNFIAMWDGQEWLPLTEGASVGTTSPVHALNIDSQDNLYVGGEFTFAGGKSSKYIAVWDGLAWRTFDSVVGVSIYDLALDGDNLLYAGGSFTMAGGQSTPNIAQCVDCLNPPPLLDTPTNLIFTTVSSKTLELSWDTVANATHYTIVNSVGADIETEETTYNFTGLTANTEYTFTVKAHDQYDQESALSAQAAFTTTAISAEDFIDNHNDGLLTDWTIHGNRTWSEVGNRAVSNVAGSSGFLISNMDIGGNGVWEALIAKTFPWSNPTDGSITGGLILRFTDQDNYYFVSPYISSLFGASPQNVLQFCVNSLINQAPAQCSNVASDINFNGDTFLLGIKAVDDEFTFFINGEEVGTHIDDTHPAGKVGYGQYGTWSGPTPTFGTASWYEINTIDSPPSPPANLIASSVTSASMTLSWDLVEGAVSYVIINSAGEDIETLNTEYTFENLTPNTEYDFQVKAIDANEFVSELSDTISSYTAPSIPGIPDAEPNGQTSMIVSWSNNENPAETVYEIYSDLTEEIIGSTTATTYLATGLTPNTSYQFTIRAQSFANEENWSEYSDASEIVATEAVSNQVQVKLIQGAAPITYALAARPEQSHTVTITAINEGVATLTIESDPVTVNLAAGESENIDTDGNGINDTTVQMQEVGEDYALFQLLTYTPPTISAGSGGGLLFPLGQASIGDTQQQPSETTSAFPDTAGHWGEIYIQELKDKGIIQGREDGKFYPDAPITRAELLKIILESDETTLLEVTEASFSDVESDTWYATYIETALHLQYIEGYEDGTFKPNDPINRAESLAMILKASQIPLEFETSFTFHDTLNTAWYGDLLSFAVEKKIINGYQNGNFGPSDSLTRAQAAKIKHYVSQIKAGISP
ncbi:hypothetical protein CVV38_01160 [Candidatus Peregrinibacteria bacterium HGW-Peregrinibacteria-1]|jgi:chitodextrinase|nr:MAG: hypothetical protein CVV38_01160 [Candidatus Peregrinibacteria bacterium HGW-Peregrinibacteria-1]